MAPYLLHGEAVAIGMMVAGRIAIALGYFSQSDLRQQEQSLKIFGLPVVVPQAFASVHERDWWLFVHGPHAVHDQLSVHPSGLHSPGNEVGLSQ